MDTEKRKPDKIAEKITRQVPEEERKALAVDAREAFDPVEEASDESFPASDAPGWR